MKSVNINGERVLIKYRTNSEMYTRMTSSTGKTRQYGADVYDAETGAVVIVATARNGTTLQQFIAVISSEEYEKISDLYDCYNVFIYHSALMSLLKFS